MIVGRHLVGLRARHFDEKALHAIEAKFQRADATAFALALLQLQQQGIAVGGDTAQFVQLLVVACGDDAAIAQQRGGLVGYGARQQRVLSGMIAAVREQRGQQR